MGVQELLGYIGIIRKWWWAIFLLFGATVGTMLAIAFLTETEYESTVTLQISAPPPQEVPLYSQFGRQALQDEIAQTQTGLNGILLEGNAAWSALERLPEVSMQGDQLQEKISVEIPDNSQLMRVSVRASNPDTAALLANTVVEVALEQYGVLQAKPTANTRHFIEQQLKVARAEVKAAEAEFAQFQISNKIGRLDRAIDRQYDLIRSLNTEHDLARAASNPEKAQAIQEIILEREAELQDMIGLSAQYNEMADRVTRARTTFNFLLDRKSEAQIKENQILALNSVQIITPARPSRRPVAAINEKLVVLGGVVSLLAGILLTFLLEYLEISGAFGGFRPPAERAGVVPVPDSAG